MSEKEFNLLEEPWIKVSGLLLEPKEVSLTDAVLNAHEYVGLSGETPTQDAALFRVLLAIALTVFYRYDENGNESEISEENDSDDETVLERWKNYWDQGRFPEKAVRNYLEKYSERFWLFHPETPFWQVNGLQYGTEYGVECLVGNIKESNNKATRHHFSMVEGDKLIRISYAEAARWLVHLNAYGVNVKADKNAPGTKAPVGIGRLGQMGLVFVNGDDLFRILMLNMCPLDTNSNIWKLPKPCWEQKTHLEQGREIVPPDNLPERYTVQSRRIMLKKADGFVTGFRAIGGDFYPIEDDFNEPMTLWREKKGDKKQEKIVHIPKVHNPATHAWEEFPALIDWKDGEKFRPGIVRWVETLNKEKIFSTQTLLTFKMVGIVYGDQMKYTYGDCVNDSLMMSSGLLTNLGKVWITLITGEVEKCQTVAAVALSQFSTTISKLAGESGRNTVKDTLIRYYYCLIDNAFREWLADIDPVANEREDKLAEWERKSYTCASQTVEDYIRMRNINIYAYKNEDSKIFTLPKALNDFYAGLRRIYPTLAVPHGKESQ